MSPSWAATISPFRCALPKLRISDCQLPITGQYQKHSPSSRTLQSLNLSYSDRKSPKVVEAQQRCFLFRCFAVPYHEDQWQNSHQQISSEKYLPPRGCCVRQPLTTINLFATRMSVTSSREQAGPSCRELRVMRLAVRICSSKIPVTMYSIEEPGQSTDGLRYT